MPLVGSPPSLVAPLSVMEVESLMSVRLSHEMQGVEDGVQSVLIRIPLERPPQREGGIEVTVLVGVPAIDSDEQMEMAARERAKLALQDALARFP